MMAAAGGGAEPWKSISLVQLFISESNFPHGTRLVFDVGEALAERMREPTLIGLDAPQNLLLPCRSLSLTFEAAGMMAVSKGSHEITVALGEIRLGDRCRGPAGPGRRKSDYDRLPGVGTGGVRVACDHLRFPGPAVLTMDRADYLLRRAAVWRFSETRVKWTS